MIPVVNIRDSYKYYVKNYNNPYKKRYTYFKIVSGFLAFMIRKMFEGYEVQLSAGKSFGSICITGKKLEPSIDENGNIRGLPVDKVATYKLWNSDPQKKTDKVFVYHFNEHSGGIKYNLRWWSNGMYVANKILYSLVFCKPARRMLTRMIVTEKKEYYVKPKKFYNGRK